MLLGAAVGFADDVECALLQSKCSGFHKLFFQRLRKMCDPCGAAILGVCGVPKINHVIRSHTPAVSNVLTEVFDALATGTWREWCGADPDDIDAQIVAHLPRKLGGLGFTRASFIAEDAYTASRNRGLELPGAVDQHELTSTRNKLIAAELSDRSAPHKQLLKVAKEQGTSAWLQHPTLRVSAADFGAALRMRLLAALPNCPDELTCPGCMAHLGKAEWSGHVVGCPQLQGHDSRAGRHRQLKTALKHLMWEAGVGVDKCEPREYQCEGCAAIHDELELHRLHRKTCTKLTDPQRVEVGREQGPDIRCDNVMKDVSFAAHAAAGEDGAEAVDATDIMIDVTVVAACAPTHRGKAVGTMFSEASARKVKQYGAMSTRRREPLYVAAATHLGHLSPALTELVRNVCAVGHMDAADAWAEIGAKVAFASAAILRNAERRRQLIHRPTAPAPVVRTVVTTQCPQDPAPTAATVAPDAAPTTPPRQLPSEASTGLRAATPPPTLRTAQPPATPTADAAPRVSLWHQPQTPIESNFQSDAAMGVVPTL